MLTTTASLRASALGVDGAQPRVEPRRVEVGQRDDLGGDAQRGLRADVLDARGDLGLVALAPQLRAAGVEEVAGHEVQEVLPRALGAPVAKARELLLEVLVVAALDEGHELAPRRSRASPVTRLESEWVFEETKYSGASPSVRSLSVGAHGRPPAPRHALVADLRAAEHAHAHRLALARRSPACAPRSARPTRRPAAPSRRARRRAPPRTPRASAPSLGGQPAASMRRRILFHSIWKATSVGTRSSTSDSEASRTASTSSPLSYQRRRRAGASTASHCSSGPIPARRKSAASWPMTTILMRTMRLGQAPDRRR